MKRENLEQVVPEFANPYYTESSDKTELSAFGQASYSFNKLKIFGDIQLRHASLNINPDYQFLGLEDEGSLTTSWLFLNPKIGATYKYSNNTNFYASVGQTNREPRSGAAPCRGGDSEAWLDRGPG